MVSESKYVIFMDNEITEHEKRTTKQACQVGNKQNDSDEDVHNSVSTLLLCFLCISISILNTRILVQSFSQAFS